MSYAGEAFDRQWRALVRPAAHRNPAPAPRYNLVVIGAGPAGLVTAIAAAGLGARVALVERHALGGDCLNAGCVPSKALLWAAGRGMGFDQAFAWMREVRASAAKQDSVARYTHAGVDVFLGECRFVDAHTLEVGGQRLRTRKTVVAAGARPDLPPIPGLAEAGAHTNETIFDLAEQPRRLAILGAGPVGCELAQAFARLGTQVHLFEAMPRVLPREESDASALVAGALERDGVRLHLGRRVARIERCGSERTVIPDGGGGVPADALLVAAGRVRNVEGLGLERAGVRTDARGGIAVDARLRTTHPDIYAAGDVCAALQFTHHADAHARIAVQNALFPARASTRALVVPVCTYTQPEVARAGMTKDEARQAGRAFDAWRVEWSELDRGRTDGASEGFAEVLTAKSGGRIIGATLVGKDAGEQLAPLLLLMSNGLGLETVGRTIFPYPTRSEYLRRLGDAFKRRRLTPRIARLCSWWLARRR